MDDPNPTIATPTPDPTPAPTPLQPESGPAPQPEPESDSWSRRQRRRRDRDRGRSASVIGGLIVIGIGLWFFAETTLGIDMPNIRWSTIWPVILIVIGAVLLLGAYRRDRR